MPLASAAAVATSRVSRAPPNSPLDQKSDFTLLQSLHDNFCLHTKVLYIALLLLDSSTVVLLWVDNFSSRSPKKLIETHEIYWLYYIISISQFVTVIFSFKTTISISNSSIVEANMFYLNRLKSLQFYIVVFLVIDVITTLHLLLGQHFREFNLHLVYILLYIVRVFVLGSVHWKIKVIK